MQTWASAVLVYVNAFTSTFLCVLRPDFARGYGGRYGVETDRVDKSAAGADYHAPKVGNTSEISWLVDFCGAAPLTLPRLCSRCTPHKLTARAALAASLAFKKR
jgi:hypothetical protein